MAARLEWRQQGKTKRLLMGPWDLALVPKTVDGNFGVVVTAYGKWPVEGHPYEMEADAMQDAESEVRRLLREAGVEIE